MKQSPATVAVADDLFEPQAGVEEATAQYVSFRLGTEWYAVDIAHVREVVRCAQLTYLPAAPGHIAGAVNLRGNIVSVTDARRLFGMAANALTARSRIVVVESGPLETGLLVDEMGQVLTVPVSRLEPPLATLDAARAAFIEHVCRCEGRLMAVLRPEKLLAGNEA
jgi:purine-binding chemotaxis protein CheW